MKILLKLSTSILFLSVLFTGCSSQPDPFKSMAFKNKDNKINVVIIGGSINLSSGDTELEVQSTAAMLKEAAKILKENGYEYFVIKKAKIPPMINNMRDLVAYCYPSYKRSTSLEEKCNITPIFNNSRVRFWFVGVEDDNIALNSFKWSTEQVMNDTYVNQIIKEGLEPYKTKKFTYRKYPGIITWK